MNKQKDIMKEMTSLYINKKNQKPYMLVGRCINCTNDRDGEKMVVYTDGKLNFVRNEKEFFEKFERFNRKSKTGKETELIIVDDPLMEEVE